MERFSINPMIAEKSLDGMNQKYIFFSGQISSGPEKNYSLFEKALGQLSDIRGIEVHSLVGYRHDEIEGNECI